MANPAYETFSEIRADLLQPLAAEGLDMDTQRRLYESKLQYLEQLRVSCFKDMNARQASFSSDDLALIAMAIRKTRYDLRQLVMGAIARALQTRT